MANEAFYGKAVEINGTVVSGIVSQNFNPGQVKEPVANSNTLHQRFIDLKRAAPKITFSTKSVVDLLAKLTNAETPLIMNSGAGFKMYLAKEDTTGPGSAASGHVLRTVALGGVFLDKLSWSIGSRHVVAECTVLGICSDGTTDPVVVSASATFPVDGDEEPLAFIGATIGGSAVPYLQSWEINFAHKYVSDGDRCFDAGLPFPKRLDRSGPIAISAKMVTMDQALTVPASGAVVLTCKNIVNGGTIGTTVTTITLRGMAITVETVPADADTPSMRNIDIPVIHDGTNRPVTIATA